MLVSGKNGKLAKMGKIFVSKWRTMKKFGKSTTGTKVGKGFRRLVGKNGMVEKWGKSSR